MCEYSERCLWCELLSVTHTHQWVLIVCQSVAVSVSTRKSCSQWYIPPSGEGGVQETLILVGPSETQ